MEFHSMKRKELQSLCKKHGIPANLSNLEMANKLTQVFKEMEKPLIQGRLEEHHRKASQTESIVGRKVKKVRFSPEHEMIEFTRSREKNRGSRRNSVVSKNTSVSVGIVAKGELCSENEGSPHRVTRSRVVNLMEERVQEKQIGREGGKSRTQKKNNVTAAPILDNRKLQVGDVDSPGRVMRLRGKTLLVGAVMSSRKRGRKEMIENNESNKTAVENVDDEKLMQEKVNIPVRVTRSKGKKLTETSTVEEKRGKKVVESNDGVDLATAGNGGSGMAGRISLRSRGTVYEKKLDRAVGVSMKNNGKKRKESLDVEKVAEEHLLRRSKRKAHAVDDSEMANDDKGKAENGRLRGLNKRSKSAVVDAEITGSKGEPDSKVEVVKDNLRSTRRKSTITTAGNLGNDKLEAENVSKDDRVPQPGGAVRRSKRCNGNLGNVAATENLPRTKRLSEPCPVENEINAVQGNVRRSRRNASDNKLPEITHAVGGDAVIQHKNIGMKQKKIPIPREEDIILTNSNPSSQRTRSNRRKKVVDATVEISADKKPSSRSNKTNLNASPHLDQMEIGKSLASNVQLSVPDIAESTNDHALNINTDAKDATDNVRLTSDREILDTSIADSSGSQATKSIDGEEMSNADDNAESKMAELQKHSSDTNKEVVAKEPEVLEKADLLQQVQTQELVEESISIEDKNEVAVQTASQIMDSSCHNKIDDNLPEGSNVSGNAGSAKTSSLADTIVLSDQTYFNADLEDTATEADKHLEPSTEVFGEANDVSFIDNLDSIEPVSGNQQISPMEHHPGDLDLSEASNKSSEKVNEEGALRIGEAGVFDACEGQSNPTVSKGASAEAEKSCVHTGVLSDLVETNSLGSTENHETSREKESECNLSKVLDCEMTAGITGEDRVTGEYYIKDSDENARPDDSPTTSPSLVHADSAEIKLSNLQADTDGDKQYLDKVDVETDAGGFSAKHGDASDEHRELTMVDLLASERIDGISPRNRGTFSAECPKDSDELRMFHVSPAKSPATMDTNCKEIEFGADKVDAETDAGGFSANRGGESDEKRELTVDLFASERIDGISPPNRGKFSAECPKESDELRMFHVSPAKPPATMDTNGKEIEFGAESSSSLQETNCPRLYSISNSQGIAAASFNMCQIIEEKAVDANTLEENQESFERKMQGENVSMYNTTISGENETFNQDDAINEDYEPEQLRSPLVTPITTANDVQEQEALSCGNKLAENAMPKFNGDNSTGEVSNQAVESLNIEEDANDGKCSKEKDGFADARLADGATGNMEFESPCGGKLQEIKVTDYQCETLLASNTVSNAGEALSDIESEQSWQEDELNNLFATPSGEPHQTYHETEKSKPTFSVNKSVSSGGRVRFIQNKEHEVGGESRIEYENELVSQTTSQEASEMGYNEEREGNELKLLFTTPIKIEAPPGKVDETKGSEKESDNISCLEGCKTEDKLLIQITSHKKVEEADNILNNTSCPGNSFLDNEGVEVVNPNVVTVLTADRHDECEAYERAQTEADGNREENVLSIGQTNIDEEGVDRDHESAEKITASATGSVKNSIEVGECHVTLLDIDSSKNCSSGGRVSVKSEGKMVRSSEAAYDVSEVGIEKGEVTEDNHCYTAFYEGSSTLSETSTGASREPLNQEITLANSINVQKSEAIAKEGTDMALTRDHECPWGATGWDKENDNSSPPHETFGQLESNSEVEIVKSSPVGDTLHEEAVMLSSDDQNQVIFEERNKTGPISHNVDNTAPAAENGSPVSTTEFDLFSSWEMHLLQSDYENNYTEKTGPEPSNFTWEGDSRRGENVMENSTARSVKPQVSDHFQEKTVDCNNNILTASATPACEYKEVLKESNVADSIKEYTGCGSSVLNLDEKAQEEATLFMEPAPVSRTADIDFAFDEDPSDQGKLMSRKEIDSEDGQSFASRSSYFREKEASRTILIHGTPGKVLKAPDMKENAPKNKSSFGDFTAARPAKRKALQDVQWK